MSATLKSPGPAFDASAVFLEFGGDAVFIRRLAALLSSSLPVYVSDMLAAARARDVHRMATVAHAIRGSVGNVYAHQLAALAGVIERTARNGRAVDLSQVSDLEKAVRDLLSEFVLWAETLEGPERARPNSR